MKKALFRAVAVATLAILPATAQAVPIVGTLDLTGSVRVTADGTIDWTPPINGGFGFARIMETSNGYFDVLDGSFARELDLVGIPVGVTMGAGLPNFQTFPDTVLPGLNFILDIILSCEQASLNDAEECDAGLASPFRFDEDAEGTTVIINFLGRVIDPIGAPGEMSTFTGKFDATFTNETPQQILTRLVTNGFIESPYSARKLSVGHGDPIIPEPATWLTFGAGMGLLAAHRRRRAKKAAQATGTHATVSQRASL
jgi:hypothetical protein